MTKLEISHKVDYWAEKLGLSRWSFEISYSARRPDGVAIDTATSNSADGINQKAELLFNPDNLKKVDDLTILHELFHVLLSEYNDDEERLISGLANLFFKNEEKSINHNPV